MALRNLSAFPILTLTGPPNLGFLYGNPCWPDNAERGWGEPREGDVRALCLLGGIQHLWMLLVV